MPTTAKKIVLCVDDSPEVLTSLNAILKSNYDVRAAINAGAAKKVIDAGGVALILLDLELPGINGIAFLELLQLDEHYKDIPVVFLTANSDDKTARQAIKSGAKGYITKPFAPEALLEAVQFFLED
jgi:putative two-component system response regulator